MQIKYLPGSVYKLSRYATSQTIVHEELQRRKKFLGDWEVLKSRKVPEKEIAKITRMSRSTYYRLRKALRLYGISGLERRSRCPKVFRQSKIPKEIIKIVLNIRRSNPTYGKDKIATILNETTLSI